jgi:hypothetical protein
MLWLVSSCALIGAAPLVSLQNAPGTAERDPAQLLSSLQQRLDRVALAKTRDETFDLQDEEPALIDVTPLIGVSRQRLLATLGPSPIDCPQTLSGPPTAPARRIAPCRGDDDLAYSFYALPKGWAGGGPELLLEFEHGDTCVRARWFRTQ